MVVFVDIQLNNSPNSLLKNLQSSNILDKKDFECSRIEERYNAQPSFSNVQETFVLCRIYTFIVFQCIKKKINDKNRTATEYVLFHYLHSCFFSSSDVMR